MVSNSEQLNAVDANQTEYLMGKVSIQGLACLLVTRMFEFGGGTVHLSRIARKPVLCVSYQVRQKPVQTQ